jgi:hypothetical protein
LGGPRSSHKSEDRSANRVIFVVELDDAEMIHALEHVLMSFFGSSGAESVGKSPRVESKPRKVRNSIQDQEPRSIAPSVLYR